MSEPFKAFMEYTSVHGLGRIATVKHAIHKLMWTVLFLASLSMCIFQVTRLGQQYVSSPISTTISLEYEPQAFPSVSICNLNPAKFSKIVQIPEFHHILKESSEHSSISLEKLRNLSELEFPLPNFIYTANETLNLNQYDHPLGAAKLMFEARLASLTIENLTALNDEFDMFILDCKYGGKKCDKRNFTVVRDGHLICYRKTIDDYITETAGPDEGLEVIISVTQSEFIPFVTESAGVRVIIQDDEADVFSGNGFSLPTGFEIDIGVSVSETHREPAGSEQRCEMGSTWQRKLACLTSCARKRATKECGCAPYQGFSDEIVDTCVTIEDMQCLKDSTADILKTSLCDECKFPCFERSYKTPVSMSRWPSDAYREILAVDYNWGSKIHKISTDFLRLRVFFSTLTKEIIKEELSYTSENFVSDIGGQLGLWAGLSVLSLAEVAELIVLWITYCFKKKTRTDHSDIPRKFSVSEIN